jgi:hypothetical protein
MVPRAEGLGMTESVAVGNSPQQQLDADAEFGTKKSWGGPLLAMMLLISILLGIIPLAGIVWMIVAGTISTVDGLFMSLIMLSLSGIFFLNAFWELRDRGLLAFLQEKKTDPPKQPPAPKAS